MKIRYFAETDTLRIELKEAPVADTRDLGEYTVADVDRDGNICALTIGHASTDGQSPRFMYEQVTAGHVSRSAA